MTYNCYSKPNNNLLARLHYTRLRFTYRTAPGFRPQPHEHFPQCSQAVPLLQTLWLTKLTNTLCLAYHC